MPLCRVRRPRVDLFSHWVVSGSQRNVASIVKLGPTTASSSSFPPPSTLPFLPFLFSPSPFPSLPSLLPLPHPLFFFTLETKFH